MKTQKVKFASISLSVMKGETLYWDVNEEQFRAWTDGQSGEQWIGANAWEQAQAEVKHNIKKIKEGLDEGTYILSLNLEEIEMREDGEFESCVSNSVEL